MVVARTKCRNGGDAAGEGVDVVVQRRLREHPNFHSGADLVALRLLLFPSVGRDGHVADSFLSFLDSGWRWIRGTSLSPGDQVPF